MLGGLSTIFWALMIVVSLKYVVLVMRADNRGEGGTIALLALASSAARERPRLRAPSLLLGLLGASLFFGEAVLTPAISVLSAVEGLRVGTRAVQALGAAAHRRRADRPVHAAAPGHGAGRRAVRAGVPAVVPRARRCRASGTSRSTRRCSQALDPRHAYGFVDRARLRLVPRAGRGAAGLTGAEALYADMGHFGKWPIRVGWFALVLPALVLNYFGQGALLHRRTRRRSRTRSISRSRPGRSTRWWRSPPPPTVIASQATITGAFSLTRQAIQLGYLPRMNIVHTSAQRLRADLHPGDQLVPARHGARGGARLRLLEQPGARLRRGASPAPCW